MEVMVPPNDGQGKRPGQRRRARGGACLSGLGLNCPCPVGAAVRGS